MMPSVPVKGHVPRDETSVLVSQGGAQQMRCAIDVLEHLTTVECQRCAGRNQAGYKDGEHGNQSIDRNFRPSIKRIDNSLNRRSLDFTAAVNIRRPLTTLPE